MMRTIRRFSTDCSGATGIEYALLASMLAIAVLAAVQSVHTEVDTSFRNTANAFSGTAP